MKKSEEQAKKIIQKFPNIGEEGSSEIFSKFPHLQLDYIDKLLEVERNNPKDIDLKVPNEMKLKYLELICKKTPTFCTKILELNDYPLDDSIDILDKYEAYEGIAYIYYLKKMYEKCSEEYLKVIFLI